MDNDVVLNKEQAILQANDGQAYCIKHVSEGHIDGLVQERRNSIANALELRLSCTNPWIWVQ